MEDIRKFRKNQCGLVVAGQGIVLLAFWTVLKFGLQLLLDFDNFIKFFNLENLDDITLAFVLIVTFALIIICMLFEIYIGFSAQSDGKGKKKTPVYIILAFVCVVTNVATLIGEFSPGTDTSQYTELGTLIFDFISLIVYIWMIKNALTVRKYRKLGYE